MTPAKRDSSVAAKGKTKKKGPPGRGSVGASSPMEGQIDRAKSGVC